jgi:ABC-type bacteriocin/lantibiotic exporter with double-glycine peptidase domain
MKCRGVLQCSDGLSNKVSNIIRILMDNMKLLVICIFTSTIITIFSFINVYVVLFLFNNVIYVFLLHDCMFMNDYPD